MISIIAGLTKDYVIGKEGGLPWHIPEDLKNFKKLTSGTVVIMGWRTWKSIGRPLPKRHNIVISKYPCTLEGVDVVRTLTEAIEKGKSYDAEIFLIGGASVYKEGLEVADRMYLSWIKKDYPGDVYFPRFDKNKWKVAETKEFDEFRLVRYDRK